MSAEAEFYQNSSKSRTFASRFELEMHKKYAAYIEHLKM